MDDVRELERRIERLENQARDLEWQSEERGKQIQELWDALREHRRAHAEA